MVRVSSIFSQLLSLIDRADFLRLVKVHQADRARWARWDVLYIIKLK